MQALSSQDAVQGLTLDNIDRDTFCCACVYAKSHRAPFNTIPVEHAQYPLQKVHSDIAGPVLVSTLSGCRYFVTFIGDYSRFTYVYVIQRKSDL